MAGVLVRPLPTLASIIAAPDWLIPLVVIVALLVATGHLVGISMAVTVPLTAAVIFLLTRIVRAHVTFEQAMAIATYAAVPRLLKGLLVSALYYTHVIHSLLVWRYDPFTLWSFTLALTGLIIAVRNEQAGARPA